MTMPTTCICGHVKHFSSNANGLTCCCRSDCPCDKFYSVTELGQEQLRRFIEIGWVTEDNTIVQKSKTK
jgi:hypothetical protein